MWHSGRNREGGRRRVVRTRGLMAWLTSGCAVNARHWRDEWGRVVGCGWIIWVIHRSLRLLSPRRGISMIRGGDGRRLDYALGGWQGRDEGGIGP